MKCAGVRSYKRKPAASGQEIRAMLLQEALRTTAICDEAIVRFDMVSQVSHPDAGQNITEAARNLTIARNEMVMAYNRLENCLEHAPAELKRSGKLNQARAVGL